MTARRRTPEPIMSIRVVTAALLIAAGTACHTDLFYSASDPLVGRWRAAPMALQPSGEYLRRLDLANNGRYVRTGTFRGVYPQLPADAIASISREYGRYVYENGVLRFSQDSVRSWDYLTGEQFHAGPGGMSIEGPPTDPAVEIMPDRLILRYMVNPGGGYVPVQEEYFRDILPLTAHVSRFP
jgi:hypothetical protein